MRSLRMSSPRSESEPGTLKRLVNRSPRLAAAKPPTTSKTSQIAMIGRRWRMTERVQRAIGVMLGRRDDLGKRRRRGAHGVEVGRLDDPLEVEHASAERVERVAPDDGE